MALADEYVFLVDENLTPDLAIYLRGMGIDAYHVNEARRKYQRVTDDMIRRFSLNQPVVVITSDDDFVKSYFSRGVPEKLVFVFGMANKDEVLRSFGLYTQQVLQLLESASLVEVSSNGVRKP